MADKSKHHDVLLDPKHVTNDQKNNVVGTFEMVRMTKSGRSGNVEKAKKTWDACTKFVEGAETTASEELSKMDKFEIGTEGGMSPVVELTRASFH